MTQRDCDCGCGKEIRATGDATVLTWCHPQEGGKYFAGTECRDKYLKTVADSCLEPGCEIWLLKGSGPFCKAHQMQTATADNTLATNLTS